MVTVGTYLATRLAQIGLKHHFSATGADNEGLLRQLGRESGLAQVVCRSDTHAAFAADGYARAKGVAACVMSCTSRDRSVLQGIRGAHEENLSLILLAERPDSAPVRPLPIRLRAPPASGLAWQLEIAESLTCTTVALTSASDAPYLIDHALRASLREHKPAYIEIPSELVASACMRPGPFAPLNETSPGISASMNEAVACAATLLERCERPMLLAGAWLRDAGAQLAFRQLAEVVGCAVAVLPGAKGLFPENHPQHAGNALAGLEASGCNELVGWADGLLCTGTSFTDFNSAGWRSFPGGAHIIDAGIDRVNVAGRSFRNLRLAEFLTALVRHVTHKPATAYEFARIRVPRVRRTMTGPGDRLTLGELSRQVHALLNAESTLLVDAGERCFTGSSIPLPEGAAYESDSNRGQHGWSAGAALGYALGAPRRRLVVMAGDGAWRWSGEELAQMIHHRCPIVLFLITCAPGGDESRRESGIDTTMSAEDNAALVATFNVDTSRSLGLCADTGETLAAAIARALQNTLGPTLIACKLAAEGASPPPIRLERRIDKTSARLA